jgi:TonB family protein
MASTLDILDERDPLGRPFVVSVLVHCALAGLFISGWYWMNRTRETLGEAHPAGGPAYAVSPVSKIPIPQRDAPPNPVAADTNTTAPPAPAKQDTQRQQPPPDKQAIEIPDRLKKQTPTPDRRQNYRPPAPQNQVYSQSRSALSSPMYAPQSGSGQVGIGANSPLGNRLGWYAELIRQRIAQHWQTNGLDSRSQMTPAIVSFSIMRDGSIRDVRILQASGNPNIDTTAERAVYQASPLPALPPQVSESYISAQFTFNLR